MSTMPVCTPPSLGRRYPFPTYPSPQELGFPVLPAAPLAPDDDEALYEFGWSGYADLLSVYYSFPARQRDEQKALVRHVLSTLRSTEIPPAEWLTHRFATFVECSLTELHHPPVTYVFSPTVLSDELARGEMSWLGSLSQPRIMAHSAGRRAIASWNERRRDMVNAATNRTLTPDDLHRIWGNWPGVLEMSRLEGRKIQEEWEAQVSAGRYIWATAQVPEIRVSSGGRRAI